MSIILESETDSLHITDGLWFEILKHCGCIIECIVLDEGSVFFNRRDGVTPHTNDGFKVTNAESAIMGRALLLYAEYDKVNFPNEAYFSCKWELVDDIGDWMVKSNGFKIL